MKTFITGIVHLFLLCYTIGSSAAAPLPPEPMHLAADWWQYIQPEPDIEIAELTARVAKIEERLDQLEKSLPEEQKKDLLPEVQSVRALLAVYLEKRSTEASLPDPLPVPQETYSLQQAYALYADLHKLSKELAYERDELEWKRDLFTAEKKQHDRLKVRYLESDPDAADRLSQGLALMRSKIQLSINTIDLDQRQQRLNHLAQKHQELTIRIDNLADKITFEAANIAVWSKLQDEAAKQTTALQDNSGPSSLATDHPNTFGVNTAMARLDTLRTIYHDQQVATAKLTEQRAKISIALIRHSFSAVTAEELSTLKNETEQQLTPLDLRQKYWRGAIARMQTASGGEAGPQADSPGRKPIKKNMEKMLGAVNQSNATFLLEQDLLRFSQRLIDHVTRSQASVAERGITSSKELLKEGWSSLWSGVNKTLFEVNGIPVTILGLLRIAMIVAFAWALSFGVRRGLHKLASNRSLESRSAYYSVGRIAHYILLGLGLIVGLSSIGIDFTKFALLISALGIGIGFGMQALASNFVAGLIILFEKSLKVGDFVELGSGVTGEVKEINMRATLITTNDNVDILVPNSEFVASQVTNWTLREAYRRIHIAFGVAYGTDKELVKKAVLEAAEDVRWTLKTVPGRRPQVWLVNFGESSLDFELVVWLVPEAVKRPAAVQANYLWEIETKLANYGIEIPFPQRDLHVKSMIPNGAAAIKPGSG